MYGHNATCEGKTRTFSFAAAAAFLRTHCSAFVIVRGPSSTVLRVIRYRGWSMGWGSDLSLCKRGIYGFLEDFDAVFGKWSSLEMILHRRNIFFVLEFVIILQNEGRNRI